MYAIESVDGRVPYYSKIWRSRTLEKTVGCWGIPLNACCWFGWDVARTGIYFLNLDFPPNGRIEFFALPTASPPQSSLSTRPVSLFGGLNESGLTKTTL